MNASESTCGRVLLHLLCMLRDHHWLWHWKGIKRELPHAYSPDEDGIPSRPAGKKEPVGGGGGAIFPKEELGLAFRAEPRGSAHIQSKDRL